MQDDGPDEAEGELGVAVHDLIAADVHQLDLHTHSVHAVSRRACTYMWSDTIIYMHMYM